MIPWQLENRNLQIGAHMPMIGQPAPLFTTRAVVDGGEFKDISLADFKGKWVVLFFYPLDFTFVCPTEIQEFSKRGEDFKKLNATVLGVSVVSEHSHKAWVNGTLGELSYPLLSDLTHDVARRYNALIEDSGIS